MNVVFISPNFPPNYRNFCYRLKEQGANVLGLADTSFGEMSKELQDSITEYYQVNNMHNYDELVRALGYFTHKYGKIDRLDSQNEFWLETEAKLRTDFNITGIRNDSIEQIKRKSQMKRVFKEAGLNPARGQVCHTEDEVLAFIKEVGYPVVAKPDIGVGAAKTYKLESKECVEHYLSDKLPVDYILEEFIQERIVTFDGLVDDQGKLVFSSSLRYSKGVMEAVNEDTDLYYYFARDLEPKLEDAGLKTLEAFKLKGRFFHFEYFMKENGDVIPLEVNMRPPGGLTLDMFNYANDFDCYRAWSDVVLNGKTDITGERKYHVIYVSRKDRINYNLPHHEVVSKFPDLMIFESRIEDVFAPAIGNHGYVLRSEKLEPLLEAANQIHERAK